MTYRDIFNEDFHDKVSFPVTEIIFNYMKNNFPGFAKMVKEDGFR